MLHKRTWNWSGTAGGFEFQVCWYSCTESYGNVYECLKILGWKTLKDSDGKSMSIAHSYVGLLEGELIFIVKTTIQLNEFKSSLILTFIAAIFTDTKINYTLGYCQLLLLQQTSDPSVIQHNLNNLQATAILPFPVASHQHQPADNLRSRAEILCKSP